VSNPFESKGPDFENEALKTVDSSWDSPFHTLGKGATQAAPGNHKHPDLEKDIDDAEAAAKAYADAQDAAHVAALDPHPQYAEDTEVTDLFDILEAMGQVDSYYDGDVTRTLVYDANGNHQNVSPALAYPWTNPLNRKVLIRVDLSAFFYVPDGAQTNYARVEAASDPNAVMKALTTFRADHSFSTTQLWDTVANAYAMYEVEAGATISLRVVGYAGGQTVQAYMKFIRITTVILGIVA